jgi:HAD superfamily hydrolase (TIGR01509 family)
MAENHKPPAGVDAPDNTAPPISPQIPSSMPRAEDDDAARLRSPEFSDRYSMATDDRRDAERWIPGVAGPPVRVVLLDVDGTLVDSNDAHARAWVRAFAENGILVDATAVRQAIGMGGDKLLPRVGGIEEDSPQGKRIEERRAEIFRNELLDGIQPFRDADQLVSALKSRGLTLVVASSASRDELDPLLDRAGVKGMLDSRTSSDDASASKPAPDIVHAALARAHAHPSEAIMIGDTPYDVQAALRAGVRTIAFRSGGWRDKDLHGAIAIYDGPWELLEHLETSPLAAVGV